MKAAARYYATTLFGVALLLQSCSRSTTDVWEDTKSAGRHVQQGVRTLGGKNGDSRQVASRSDFECIEDEDCSLEGSFQDCDYQEGLGEENQYSMPETGYSPADNYQVPQNYTEEFVPLEDPNGELSPSMMNARPPRESPGDAGSSVPGIQAFRDPTSNPRLASIFRPIYFDYNSDLVRGAQNLQTIHTIADYLQRNPNMYLFVEGHTDERGPQAYNLALGSRRANAIRNLLINDGVNPDKVFTISYGKERPLILESHEEGWSKNRRGEFKIYEQ